MVKMQVVSKQAQNRKHQKSKAASTNQWLSSKASRFAFWMFLLLLCNCVIYAVIFFFNLRSTLQTKSKQADYAEDDFEIVGEVTKSK